MKVKARRLTLRSEEGIQTLLTKEFFSTEQQRLFEAHQLQGSAELTSKIYSWNIVHSIIRKFVVSVRNYLVKICIQYFNQDKNVDDISIYSRFSKNLNKLFSLYLDLTFEISASNLDKF